MNGTVIRPKDISQEKSISSNQKIICSRCQKVIKGVVIEVKANYLRLDQQQGNVYRYDEKCIRSCQLRQKVNLLIFDYLYWFERFKRKLVVMEYLLDVVDEMKDIFKKMTKKLR